MGINDAAEMLAEAKTEVVRLERENRNLRQVVAQLSRSTHIRCANCHSFLDAGFVADLDGVRYVTWLCKLHGTRALVEQIVVAPTTDVDLYEEAEARYRAAHPEFQPSDIVKGEEVLDGFGLHRGVVTDVRENGASLTVAWDSSPHIRQNLNSGSVIRTREMRA